jgi:hypothetical protein
MVDDAEARSTELVSDAERRLAELREEREAVASYVEGLRGVLSQAEKVTAEH